MALEMTVKLILSDLVDTFIITPLRNGLCPVVGVMLLCHCILRSRSDVK